MTRVFGLLLLCACATAPVASRGPEHVVNLFGFAAQPRLPYVKLRIGQTEGWFLVDSGASVHVMSVGFFHQAFPGRSPGRQRGMALPWSGKPMPVSVAAGVPVGWPDGSQEPMDFAVVETLPDAHRSGLVGMVSPQRLADSVELDFVAGQLRWPAGGADGMTWSLEERTLYACGPSRAHVWGVATAIEGQTLWGLLDTGSVLTALSLAHPLGQALLPSQGGNPMLTGDASSTPLVGVRAPAQGRFAGLAWAGEIALMQMPGAPCGFPAVVGMDVLRHCRVTLAQGEVAAACRP